MCACATVAAAPPTVVCFHIPCVSFILFSLVLTELKMIFGDLNKGSSKERMEAGEMSLGHDFYYCDDHEKFTKTNSNGLWSVI